MNARFVIRQLGMLLAVLSVCILFVSLWEAVLVFAGDSDESAALYAMAITTCVGLVLGAAMWHFARGGSSYLGRREALLLVAMSWLVGAGVAALPYYLWTLFEANVVADHPFAHFADCYFEAMSGLTTTGASVLSDIEALPKGLLLWRSFTQWLGGLGIVVLFVAVLPTLGVGGKKMFQVESTIPTATGVRPRIRETARVLWLIYVAMTFVQIILLKVFGMTWFDAVCHTFTTMSTGGFSTVNSSIGGFTSTAIRITIIIFMLLGGINFGLYYNLIRGRYKTVLADPELRLYLIIITAATVIVSLFIAGAPLMELGQSPAEAQLPATAGQAVLHALFQVISIMTTTGFATVDFDRWSFVPQAVIIALMFVGGCAGSTAGGIKVIRILVAAKVLIAGVETTFRPNVVRTVRVGKSIVDPDVKLGTLVYLVGILVLFLLGAVLLMLFEMSNGIDFTTAATASATTLNNVGPGLARVGPSGNFGWFSAPSKIVMSLLMVLGRLEVYAIFVLFMPRFWKGD